MSIKLNVLNCAGDKLREQELDPNIFDVADRADILHQVVLWQLAKKRVGSACAKTRAEVSGSGRKPHKQKGSGRARLGSIRAPHCEGGGVIHAPKHRDYSYKLNKKVRKLGLKVAISSRQKEHRMLLVDGISSILKTNEMQNSLSIIMKSQGIEAKKILILSNDNIRSVQNMPNVNSLPVVGLNSYSILRHDLMIIDIAAIDAINERLK
jgi:large subunit ribosomal protein L4